MYNTDVVGVDVDEVDKVENGESIMALLDRHLHVHVETSESGEIDSNEIFNICI